MEASLDTVRPDGENEPLGMADELMARGGHLRKLRQLEKADEEERERQKEEESRTMKNEEEPDFDCIASLSNGQRVLRYESYLQHQRYYDDLKHVDCTLIDYGIIGNGRLIIEQEKELGKGGLCWDAAFILGEHMIDCQHEWITESTSKIVELGSGTGLCGAMIAKTVPKSRVEITDLPELKDLMERNIALNFDCQSIISTAERTSKFSDEDLTLLFSAEDKKKHKSALGCISASVLRWGCDEDYRNGPYDVVFGADVVASLYDPVALARTIHSLCHEKSSIYISYKGRLTGPHEIFERELHQLFHTMSRIKPSNACRNKNPEVWILKATGRISQRNP